MANEEHVKLLLSGVEAWNKWRKDNRDIIPDLRGVSISVNLQDCDLRRAMLQEANLSWTNLQRAILVGANLNKARLFDAKLQETNLDGADLQDACLTGADLRATRLGGANLQGASLLGANLEMAYLCEADFTNANIRFVRTNRKTYFRNVIIESCRGSPRLRRFAMDQDYIEEMKETLLGYVRYWLWWATSDCGRSIHADLLNKRHTQGIVSNAVQADDFIAGDYFLLLWSLSPRHRTADNRRWRPWRAWSTLYITEHSIPKFLLKSLDKDHAQLMTNVLRLETIDNYRQIVLESRTVIRKFFRLRVGFDPLEDFNIDKIGTQ